MKLRFKRIMPFLLTLVMVLCLVSNIATEADAATLNGLDSGFAAKGLTITYTAAGNGGTVKWEPDGTTGIKGSVTNKTTSGSWPSKYYQSETTTLTFSYSGTTTMKLSFDFSGTITKGWDGDYGGSAKVDGTTYSKVENFGNSVTEKEMNSGDSLTITISTTQRNTNYGQPTTSITISNLVFEDPNASANPNVTFKTATNGSYTVDTNAVTAETVLNKAKEESYDLKATPATGYNFFGWYSSFGGYFSYSAETTYRTDADCEVYPVFVSTTTPIFGVGTATTGTYKDYDDSSIQNAFIGSQFATEATYYNVSVSARFTSLNEAAAYAKSSGNSYVVLLNSGTLPAGTHTIPSGVTLLIPFEQTSGGTYTLYTTTPCSTAAYTQPKAFCTLTMAEGATLKVEGALSLSGKHMRGAVATLSGASPTGPQGFINMNSGSKISVEKGGTLYAYGYITGAGSVEAKSGAKVYELFQLADFRGGTQTTTELLNNDQKVFFFNYYYVQNIEVPLTLNAGATEYSFTTIYMNAAAISSSVAFIGGEGCMFAMSDGYVVKTYDGSRDRLVLDAHGNVSLSPISMVIAKQDVNTSSYVLPINGNITVNVNSGSIYIAQDIALLPGAEINIASGTTCTVGSGVSAYAYDADDWGTYSWGRDNGTPSGNQVNVKMVPVMYAPGRSYTRKEADLTDVKIHIAGTLDATAGSIYTTAGGAAVTGEAGAVVKMTPGTAENTWQMLMNLAGNYDAYQDTNKYLIVSSDDDVYVKVPVTSAVLTNGEGVTPATVETAKAAANTIYNYCATCDKWVNLITVSFNANVETTETMTALITHAGCTAQLPVNTFTAPEGYAFAGWNTVAAPTEENPGVAYADEAFIAAITEGDPSITETTTLYAQWELIDVTIDFDANGGDEVLDHTGKYFTTYTAPPATREGYTFLGWDDNNDATDTTVLYEAGAEITLNKDIPETLYAKWKINTYTVAYVKDANTTEFKTVDWGTEITIKTLDDTDTHTFTGWKDGDGNAYAAGDKVTIKADLTLTAQWEEKPTGLKGDVDLDGTVGPADLTKLARHVAEIELLTDETALANADVTGDDAAGPDDLTKLARYVAEIIDSLD